MPVKTSQLFGRSALLARTVRSRVSCWPGVQVAREVVRDGREDRVGSLAAELAFFALLSVFPGLLAVAAALGALDGVLGVDVVARAEREVVGVLSTLLTDEGRGAVDAARALFRDGSAGVFTFGVVAALWAASRGMAALLRTLSEIYDWRETRSAIKRRAVALGLAVVVTLLVAVVLAMIVLGPLFGAGREVADALGLRAAYGTIWNWMALPVGFLALLSWSAVAFHAVPHAHVGWRPHFAGAAVTGVLWLAASAGFRLYLHAAGGNAVFGVLGGALVVLLWLYLMSLGLLIGAELNAVLMRRANCGAPPTAPQQFRNEPSFRVWMG